MIIHYIGFKEATGYGIAASTLAGALRDQRIQVAFTGIRPGNTAEGGLVVESEDGTTAQYDAVIVHTVPEYFPFWFQKEKRRSPRAKIWGYTTWETDQLPLHWPALLNLMDGIFVPSSDNKLVFKKCGVTKPIHLLPHVSQFNGQSRPALSGTLQTIFKSIGERFVFYYIGTWSDRKAPWLIIEAFNQEFNDNDKVALILKTGETDWSNYKRSWKRGFKKTFGLAKNASEKLIKNSKSKVIHISDELSDGEIALLHAKSHCFVSLTRGEGWGVASYEAAWFGKPVVITGFGGMMDYLSAKTAYLVNYKLLSVKTGYGKQSYSENQQWAQADIGHAKKLLRYIYENKAEAKQKGELLKAYVEQHFNPALIVRQCLEVLLNE